MTTPKNRDLYTDDQSIVYEFLEAADAYIGQWPHLPDQRFRNLGIALLEEELDELIEASEAGNIVLVADALADLLYCVYATAIFWGIGMRPILNEVRRSVMTKISGPKRVDGKVLKPTDGSYSPPNLEPLLEKQILE
jgi:NTP pyrophosphatase (non-canonical NTP hydrolase)